MRGTPPTRLVAVAIAVLAWVPGSARADNCQTPLTSTCINSDNLWPHAGPTRFLTFGGTETTPRGELGFGLYTSYLSRPILLQTDSGGAKTTDFAIDDQIDTSFLFSYGVTDRLELDVVVPVTLSQTGNGASAITGSSGGLDTTGVRDVRMGFAYALVPRARISNDAHLQGDFRKPSTWSLTARFELSAPTGDTAGFGSDGYAVWSPGLSADYRHGDWFGGAEVGARIRKTEELQGARVGSQAFVGLGLGRDLLPREMLSVVAEAYMLPTFSQQGTITAEPDTVGLTSVSNGQYIVPAAWMLSVRSAPIFGGDFSVQAGGGGSIPFGGQSPITDPRFRFSLSVRFAPLGRDSDGDGVRDRDDKCPYVHGIPGNPAGDGCPSIAEHEQVDLTGDTPPATTPSVTRTVLP
jgi:hypothetical protein